MITLVAAVARNGVIGTKGGLPWSLPDDLRHFRKLTVGKAVVMGRATYESIGRPLTDRTNIVLTRNPQWMADGVEVANDPQESLWIAAKLHGCDPDVCVIGGGEIYGCFLPTADRLELTIVDLAPAGDTVFPPWSADEWCMTGDEPHLGPPEYRFQTFERRPAPASSRESAALGRRLRRTMWPG